MSCASYELQSHSEIEPTEERPRIKRKYRCSFIKKIFAAMPKQTRSQSQRNKANHTSHNIPEDLTKLYVKNSEIYAKILDSSRMGMTRTHQSIGESKGEPVQDQSVDVTAAMTSHQPSGIVSTFSESQCQEVLDLMKTAISDVAEAAASRAIISFQQLQAQQSNPTISCEMETTREVNMASREDLVMAPNDFLQQPQPPQQQQQPQQRLSNEVLVPTQAEPSSQGQADNTTTAIIQALQPSLDAISRALHNIGSHLPGSQPLTAATPPGNNAEPSSPPPGFSGAPEVPPKLIKEVLKGEFFDLAKLLNRNLLKLQNLNDEFMDTSQGIELSIDPDNRMLKAKAPKRLSITTLDEWTNTFRMYIFIIISRFPSRVTGSLPIWV